MPKVNSPSEVVEALYAAIRNGDAATATSLLHTQSLSEYKARYTPLPSDIADAIEFLERESDTDHERNGRRHWVLSALNTFHDIGSLGTLAELSATQLFSKGLQGIPAAQRCLIARVLGWVPESENQCWVVARLQGQADADDETEMSDESVRSPFTMEPAAFDAIAFEGIAEPSLIGLRLDAGEWKVVLGYFDTIPLPGYAGALRIIPDPS